MGDWLALVASAISIVAGGIAIWKFLIGRRPPSPPPPKPPRVITKEVIKGWRDDARRYLNAGDTNAAISAFTQVIAHQPNSADAYPGRAEALAAKGLVAEAIVDLERSLAINDRSQARALLAGLTAKPIKRVPGRSQRPNA